MPFTETYHQFASRFLGRPIGRRDGVSADSVHRAEQRLRLKLPVSLRQYYLCLGAVVQLNHAHNRLLAPEELVIEDAHLLFMDEQQSVVTWGLALQDLSSADPEVWQRNNTPPAQWYSEEKTFTELMASMFEWYGELGLLPA